MTTLPATNPAMRGVCGDDDDDDEVVDALLPVLPVVSSAEGECAKSQC